MEGIGEEVIWLFAAIGTLISVYIGYKILYSSSRQTNITSNEIPNRSIPETSNPERVEPLPTTTNEDNSSTIKIFIKERENTKSIQINPNRETVLDLKRKVFMNELNSRKQVRIVFRGRELQDQNLLQDYDLSNECTLHAIISFQNLNSPSNQQQPIILNLNGSPILLYSLCGIILSLFWVLYFQFGEKYFSLLSLALLVGCTIILCYFIYQTLITNQPR